MQHTIHVLSAALIGFAVSAGPSPLRGTTVLAQSPATASQNATVELDARWLPWLGCWRSDAERLVSDDARLCVIPSSDHNPQAVRIVVIVGDAVATEQGMTADGSPIPISENGCTGDRRVSWSSRGASRFSRVQLTCPFGPSPKASGLSLMASGPLWLTVEVTQSYGREIVEVLKYSRASVPAILAEVLTPDLIARAGAAAETLAGRPIDQQDVIEASANIAPKAIEVALLETGTVLPVNRRTLIALDDAKVPETVIDLMVALAYPEKFAIRRPTPATDSAAAFYSMEDNWFHSLFDYPASPTFFVFYDDDGDGSGGTPAARGDVAFAVKGKGYVQVQPAAPKAVASDGKGGNGGNSIGARGSLMSGASSDTSNGGSSSSASSSGASASSSGYVGGGGGGDTGRTAVSR